MKYNADHRITDALEDTVDAAAEAEAPSVADFFASIALFLIQFRNNGGFDKERNSHV